MLFFDRKPPREKPWTTNVWVYDLRTIQHFTLKSNLLKRRDLNDFVARYNPNSRHQREESERFRRYTFEEIEKRDKLSLDLFWLKDESLDNGDDLPAPDVLTAEIAENLRDPLEPFEAVAEGLNG